MIEKLSCMKQPCQLSRDLVLVPHNVPTTAFGHCHVQAGLLDSSSSDAGEGR